jgi:hypothetical protein
MVLALKYYTTKLGKVKEWVGLLLTFSLFDFYSCQDHPRNIVLVLPLLLCFPILLFLMTSMLLLHHSLQAQEKKSFSIWTKMKPENSEAN